MARHHEQPCSPGPPIPQSLPLIVVFRLALAGALLAGLIRPLAARAQGPVPRSATSCPSGKVALVLPGGGAKGMAHVGVIQMLDSLGIVPDLVVGTSIGAIVGAMYASGYAGTDIERLTRLHDVGPYVGRYAPRSPRALGTRPPLLLWEDGEGGLSLQTSVAQEGRINTIIAALLLRGNLLARGTFDSLPIPFRAVAADLRSRERVLLGTGDLAEAVRASFAIPLIFEPMVIGGRALVDGGVAENVPVRAARELGAERVILSALIDSDGATALPVTSGAVAERLVDFLFVQPGDPLRERDVEIRSDVSGIANLDFSPVTTRAMIERGREAARALAGLPCLPRGPRRARDLPALASGLVTPGTTSAVRDFLVSTAGIDPLRPVPIDSLQARMSRLGELEAMRALWLYPTPAGDSVSFSPVVRLAARRAVGAGIVYDNELGGRTWLGLVDRSLLRSGLEGAVRGAVGELRQDATFSLRRSLENARYRRSPFLAGSFSRERVRLFTMEGTELSRDALPSIEEQVARVGVDQPLGAAWDLQVAAALRRWRGDLGRAREAVIAVGGAVRVAHAHPHAAASLQADLEWTDRYAIARVHAGTRHGAGRLVVSTTLHAGVASDGAPLTALFTLGDKLGFAGLHIGERIGSSELFGAVEAGYPFLGPLRAVASVMTGQTSDDHRRPISGEWLLGARAGLGAETPIGPVRVQYGVNTDARSAWFLRLGLWF